MATLNLQSLAIELYLQQPATHIYIQKIWLISIKKKTDLQSPDANCFSTKHISSQNNKEGTWGSIGENKTFIK